MLRSYTRKTSKLRFHGGRTVAVAGSFAALLFAATAPAQAQLVIDADFGTSITSDPNHLAIENTINTAIAVYEAKFSNPITVRMAFGKMSGGLGENGTFFDTVPYATYIAGLNATATSADDATALGILNPEGTAVNPVNGLTTIDVKTPNLRAIGINASAPTGQSFDGLTNGQWDGTVSLNTSLTTPPGSAGNPSLYSLLAVTEHEMDEVLGFGSGVGFSGIFPQDLFRYTSSGVRNFTTAGDNAFFSINGTTDIVQFNQSGGGADYGDWHTSATPQVQDAFGTPGSSPVLGPSEIRGLDVIGYTLTTVTPEPGSVGLLAGMGIAGGGAFLRRRKRTKKAA